MKKSLYWRFAISIGIALIWAVSLYPLKDAGDDKYLPMFEKMAQDKVETYRTKLKEKQTLETKLTKEMDDLVKKAKADAEKSIKTGTSSEDIAKKIADAVEKVKGGSKYISLSVKKTTAHGELQKYQTYCKNYDGLINIVKEQYKKYLVDNKNSKTKFSFESVINKYANDNSMYLSNYITIPTTKNASNMAILGFIRGKMAGKIKLGLDLAGGTEFVVSFDKKELESGQKVTDIRDQIIEILRNRVDGSGIVEAAIRPIGSNTISLRMPSVSESEKTSIRKMLKQSAKLEFRAVHPNNQSLVAQYKANPQAFKIPHGYKKFNYRTIINDVQTTQILFLNRPEQLTGTHVKKAFASMDENGYIVSLQLKGRGPTLFKEITTKYTKKRLAIVLDGTVYSAPVIQNVISGGRAQITGNFSATEAKQLAVIINCGNLPVKIKIDSEFATEATLGAKSVKSGIFAVIVGMILVVLFIIFYYRSAGAVAIVALSMNILIVLGTLTLFGATLTLPGIAGIVLTIGMAVDANVLIFERVREELLNGKSIGNAIKSGYKRAFTTIFDSNFTTFITAFILYQFGEGAIKGFAVTLSIGIAASMFTALFVTRTIFDFLLYNKVLTNLNMVYWFKKPNFDFLAKKKIAFGVSIGFAVVALLVLVIVNKKALSIDFSGGTMITYSYDNTVKANAEQVKTTLQKYGYDATVNFKQAAIEANRMLEITLRNMKVNDTEKITSKTVGETLILVTLPADAPKKLKEIQKTLIKNDPKTIETILNVNIKGLNLKQGSMNSVGDLVGSKFKRQAILAAILASIAIIIYISFRFEFSYGIASVIALLHDVFITTGIFVLLGGKISLPVVAALLTIMGYSLNDTIVVFDRIREDLGLHKKKTYKEIINLSINQTLSRTMLTSLTTLLVVIVLVLFGGGAINDFAQVMLIGIIIGTYSSVFVASSLVSTWHKEVKGHKGNKLADSAK